MNLADIKTIKVYLKKLRKVVNNMTVSTIHGRSARKAAPSIEAYLDKIETIIDEEINNNVDNSNLTEDF